MRRHMPSYWVAVSNIIESVATQHLLQQLGFKSQFDSDPFYIENSERVTEIIAENGRYTCYPAFTYAGIPLAPKITFKRFSELINAGKQACKIPKPT